MLSARKSLSCVFAVCLLAASPSFAQQAIDEAYTKLIKEFTTSPEFTTEFVNSLPASQTVPSPLAHHGYIAGHEGKLSYTEDVHAYMRAVAAASPRVKVFSIGKSEEGREMILVAVADEETIKNLDKYREITRKLSDPRSLKAEEAASLIAKGKPIYYATGAMHSPETGSPEMLMELVYRLAVDESPFIKAIRDNVITIITPLLEVDGRNRMVDLWRYHDANPKLATPPLVYWGHYVAHDNNRDNIGLSLNLSKNVMKAYFDFHPQVVHDLHESVPFIYMSTGTGPYNPSLDPMMVDEWHRMAYHEVGELTRRGVPGAWTHGFYDGWAPNYMFWMGTGHNSIGRFYETFGNSWPTTERRVVRGQSDRAWFRPNPPLPVSKWSLRNNVNYQQSALLIALNDMSKNKSRALETFYKLSERSIAKASNEGPAAYVFTAKQKRLGNLRDLLTVLQKHGVEVHTLDNAITLDPKWPPAKPKDKPNHLSLPAGSFIVRMDQPYSRLADTLLDVQFVRSDDAVYDDTGWTLGYSKNVEFNRVANTDILKARMHLWDGTAGNLISENPSDIDYVRRRFANKSEKLPRVAVMHTWTTTQDEGWHRLGLESLGISYDYISTQDVSKISDLREKYDVIYLAPFGQENDIVNGLPPGTPLPWKKTALTPNLGGVDETDDMRPGLGISGVANLTRFVDEGGLLIAVREAALWAVQYGLARFVRSAPTTKLKCPGSILKARVFESNNPVVAGYDENTPVYFKSMPVFAVGRELPTERETRPSGRGGKGDPDVPQGRPFIELPERQKAQPGNEGFQPPENRPDLFAYAMVNPEDRPRVLMSFAQKPDELLMSGMLDGAEEIANKPAIILAPRGKGNVLLFAINPMWRMNTQGSYALVGNAILNWDKLRESKDKTARDLHPTR